MDGIWHRSAAVVRAVAAEAYRFVSLGDSAPCDAASIGRICNRELPCRRSLISDRWITRT